MPQKVLPFPLATGCVLLHKYNLPLLISCTVITLAFKPDGVEVAVATLDGQISFWDVNRASQVGSIEGRDDLKVGS